MPYEADDGNPCVCVGQEEDAGKEAPLLSPPPHCLRRAWPCPSSKLSEGIPFVTMYEKTRHMGFFVKIKFDVYLISSTLELTYL